MHFHIITLFPESFDSYIGASILKRAREDKKIKVDFYNPRDFVTDNRRVDERPYGGGPGMVLRPEPVVRAIEKARGRKKNVKIILTSNRGQQFTNEVAEDFEENYKHIIIVCGRYEGIDARVKEIFEPDEISVGPYVLTGGELPAMVIMDAVARRVPGVLGTHDSIEEERVAGADVYTRPDEFKYKRKTYRVPDVLKSGDHKEIEKWRRGEK